LFAVINRFFKSKQMELKKYPTSIEECLNYIREQEIQIGKQNTLLEELLLCLKKLEKDNLELKKLERENFELKELLNMNSQNSSLPPSKDNRKKNKKNKKTPSGRSSGGQKGHKGTARKLLDEDKVDKIVNCKLKETCSCGGNIKDNGKYWQHQVHELPEIKLEVIEYRLPKGICQSCGKKHTAPLPEGVTWGITGHRLTSFMSSMVSDYQLSRMDLKRLLKEHLNFTLSEGTIYNKEKITAKALEEPVKNLLCEAKKSPFLHADETSHVRNGKKEWMWAACSPFAVCFAILASRGKKAMKSFLGDYKGTLISDRYAAYNDFEDHQFCWSHLKRDFVRLSEKHDKVIQRIGKELLKSTDELFEKWHQIKSNDKPSRGILIMECTPIRKTIGELLEQASYTDPTLKAARFAKNLLTRFHSLWVFLEKDGVEPTNNHAERCLRKSVIWRKKYFGTKSEMGDLFVSRTASVVMSCRLLRKSYSEYLTNVIKSYFAKTAPPLLFGS
jgi:transposase